MTMIAGRGRGSQLTESRKSTIGEFPEFMCRYCPESSWTEDGIRSHLANMHPDKPAQFGVVQDAVSALAAGDVEVEDDEDEEEDGEGEYAEKFAGSDAGVCIYIYTIYNTSIMWCVR